MKVEKIDHIAIMVKDLKEASKFFADLLGTEFSELGESKEADIRNAMDSLGIELIAPLTPDGPVAKSLETKGEGLSLVSLKVQDFDEAVAEMKSRGIRQIGGVRPWQMEGSDISPQRYPRCDD